MTLYGSFAMNSPRMLCATCGRTDVPDDLVFGSDRLELAAWALLLLPGLLYCLWRHANRRTVCAHCGSDVLLRETRFSRERRVAEGVQDRVGRAVYAAPRVRWVSSRPGVADATRSGSSLGAKLRAHAPGEAEVYALVRVHGGVRASLVYFCCADWCSTELPRCEAVPIASVVVATR